MWIVQLECAEMVTPTSCYCKPRKQHALGTLLYGYTSDVLNGACWGIYIARGVCKGTCCGCQELRRGEGTPNRVSAQARRSWAEGPAIQLDGHDTRAWVVGIAWVSQRRLDCHGATLWQPGRKDQQNGAVNARICRKELDR